MSANGRTHAYLPQPGSAAARAIAYLAAHCDDEASSAELAEAAGIQVNAISAYLESPMRHGLILRIKRGREAYWKLPAAPAAEAASQAETDEVADAPSIARIVPAAAAGPLAGIVRQSWCPAAQAGASESAPDEPPGSAPAEAPALGLGWKAPRTPVYLADAPTPASPDRKAPPRLRLPVFDRDAAPENTTPPSAPDRRGAWPFPRNAGAHSELEALERRHAQAVARVTAYETPQDDPDFQEVRRPPAPDLTLSMAQADKAITASIRPRGGSMGRDDVTPNDGVVPQGTGVHADPRFCCALWSDGTFSICPSDGDGFALNQRDASALIRYIGETLSARARAAA